MQSQTLKPAEQANKTVGPERLNWKIIELQVTDLDRATGFWMEALGLRNLGAHGGGIALGTGERALFILHPGARAPANPRHLGMYHVALGVPDQVAFSRLLARLIARRIPVAPVDHLMGKSIYISDPDGLGIEITFETPWRFGRFGEMSHGFSLYDANGRAHNGRERLDVAAELAHARGANPDAPLADGAFLAHLHLQVAALEPAIAWFEGLGFSKNLMLPHLGFSDLSAGGTYTHRLALNTWAGKNLAPAPPDMARLLRYELDVSDPSIVVSAPDLERSALGLTGRDPTGTHICVNVPIAL